MKKLILWMAILAVSTTALAQSKDETKVAAAVEALKKAMVEADSVNLYALTLPGLSYGHSSGHVDDQRQFVEKITSGKSDFVSINLSEQSIRISKKTAIVRHKLDAVTNDNGKPGEVHLWVLLVWQKEGGNWRLLARQAVKNQQ